MPRLRILCGVRNGPPSEILQLHAHPKMNVKMGVVYHHSAVDGRLSEPEKLYNSFLQVSGHEVDAGPLGYLLEFSEPFDAGGSYLLGAGLAHIIAGGNANGNYDAGALVGEGEEELVIWSSAGLSSTKVMPVDGLAGCSGKLNGLTRFLQSNNLPHENAKLAVFAHTSHQAEIDDYLTNAGIPYIACFIDNIGDAREALTRLIKTTNQCRAASIDSGGAEDQTESAASPGGSTMNPIGQNSDDQDQDRKGGSGNNSGDRPNVNWLTSFKNLLFKRRKILGRNLVAGNLLTFASILTSPLLLFLLTNFIVEIISGFSIPQLISIYTGDGGSKVPSIAIEARACGQVIPPDTHYLGNCEIVVEAKLNGSVSAMPWVSVMAIAPNDHILGVVKGTPQKSTNDRIARIVLPKPTARTAQSRPRLAVVALSARNVEELDAGIAQLATYLFPQSGTAVFRPAWAQATTTISSNNLQLATKAYTLALPAK